MANDDGPRLYTIEDVARRCGVHISTVKRWIHDKELSSVKLGRSRRVTQEQLDVFIRQHYDEDEDDERAAL